MLEFSFSESMPLKLTRLLLKLSGEALGANGVDDATMKRTAQRIAAVQRKNVALAIVIGGGNIWRFRDKKNLELARVPSDFLGMLATVFNAVALTAALQKLKVRTKTFSAIPTPIALAEKYSAAAANRFLRSGGVVILAGGTGKPLVTTDTAAALRAAELDCERVLKATNVDGVYSADPKKNPQAQFLPKLSFAEALQKKIGVFDAQAFRLLRQKKIPLTVFNFRKKGTLERAAAGQPVGTQIS